MTRRRPLSIVPIGRLHYLVESRSGPVPHCVDLEAQDNDPRFCSCDDFKFRSNCDHIRAARKFANEKPATAQGP